MPTALPALVHLNIRKPMLHNWRKEFARYLRAQGVPAKATPRTTAVWKSNRIKLPGIYRPANLRPVSSARSPLKIADNGSYLKTASHT
jgi:hypothetical protein